MDKDYYSNNYDVNNIKSSSSGIHFSRRDAGVIHPNTYRKLALFVAVFNPCLGIPALYYSKLAEIENKEDNIQNAQKLGREARNLSYGGICFTIVLAIVLIVYITLLKSSNELSENEKEEKNYE